jgi:hypothetical protein
MEKTYRLVPHYVQAIQFTGTEESFKEIRGFVGTKFYYDYQEMPRVFLRGQGVNQTDWIIKNPLGDFIIMTDEDFKERYEEV